MPVPEHERQPGNVLDVDALVAEIAERLPEGAETALSPFVDDISHRMGAGRFSVTPHVAPSTKPLVGPVVTRGKRMASRAAMPMVADLGAQVAAALDAMQATVDELATELERLRWRLEELERRGERPGGT